MEKQPEKVDSSQCGEDSSTDALAARKMSPEPGSLAGRRGRQAGDAAVLARGSPHTRRPRTEHPGGPGGAEKRTSPVKLRLWKHSDRNACGKFRPWHFRA